MSSNKSAYSFKRILDLHTKSLSTYRILISRIHAATQVSGHDFSRAVKSNQEIIPCAAGPRAAKRSAKNNLVPRRRSRPKSNEPKTRILGLNHSTFGAFLDSLFALIRG
jgi:hypothetical protein